MSETLEVARYNIRTLIQDLNPGKPIFDSDLLNRIINDQAQFLAGEVGMGSVWVPAAVSLTAGNHAYTLPSSIEYRTVQAVRLTSQGWVLERCEPEQIKGWVSGQTILGPPTQFSLYEDDTQVVNLWTYPVPSVADTLDILRSQVPATITDGAAIPFAAPLLRVLEHAVALALVSRASEDEMGRLGINPEVLKSWQFYVQRGSRRERIRLASMRRKPFRQARSWLT